AFLQNVKFRQNARDNRTEVAHPIKISPVLKFARDREPLLRSQVCRLSLYNGGINGRDSAGQEWVMRNPVLMSPWTTKFNQSSGSGSMCHPAPRIEGRPFKDLVEAE